MDRLPIEIIDRIMKDYWYNRFHESVIIKLNSDISIIKKYHIFLEKHIFCDIANLCSNTHLHYYLKEINKFFKNLKNDKGTILFLKYNEIYKFFPFSIFGKIDTFDSIDEDYRLVARYSVCKCSPHLRFSIFYAFQELMNKENNTFFKYKLAKLT